MTIFGFKIFPEAPKKHGPKIAVTRETPKPKAIPGGAVFEVVAIKESAFSIGGDYDAEVDTDCTGPG